jgi:predicted RNase H-like HicB family nuclease
MFKYSVSIKWSDEDNGFIAVVPELDGLSAFGETQDEAIQELMVAAEGYLEAIEESGQKIPAPEKLQSYSGQFRLRLPKWQHAKLAAEAENEGVSLNTYIVTLLAHRQGEKEAINAIRSVANELQCLYVVQAYKPTEYRIVKEELKRSGFSSGYYNATGVN